MEPDNNTNTAGATTPAESPTNNSTSVSTGDHSDNAWGPMIGVIVIVLLLVAGGFYYYMQGAGVAMPSTEDTTMTPEEQAAQDTAEVESIAEQSTSSAFSAIEADFNATDAASLDNTLNSIDSELGL